MSGKRLRKEDITVLVKVYLNNGAKKNKEFLSESEMSILNELVENQYVGLVNKSYSYVTPKGHIIENVTENFLNTATAMFELGFEIGRKE